ncbi:hypothetical protein ACQKGO_00520 [Corallococcus interemptor]|uniref:hypothetical protein n=1 Tax=Corallococcus interemptor TaxID=2316720 RepID=UPI003CFED603
MNRSFLSRRARGAASVEMALSMIAFIPIFLYALFLDDLLRYALDAQEAVVATVWDYTIQDWAMSGGGGEYGNFSQVQGYARQMYCDHESGVDDYTMDGDKARDCQTEAHHEHAALTAHPCWLNPGAQQVECTGPDKQVGLMGILIESDFADEFNHGGLIKCNGRIGVQNYMLNENTFSEFSKKPLAKTMQDKGGSVHGQAKGSDGTSAYLLPWEQMSIITDPWAINDDVSIRPGQKGGLGGGSGDFYNRVTNVYTNLANIGFGPMSVAATEFFSNAMSNNLLSPALVGPLVSPVSLGGSLELGDNPRTPNVAIKPQTGTGNPSEKIKQAGDNEYYFNTEWRDWDRNAPEKTLKDRGNNYMGCKNAESC